MCMAERPIGEDDGGDPSDAPMRNAAMGDPEPPATPPPRDVEPIGPCAPRDACRKRGEAAGVPGASRACPHDEDRRDDAPGAAGQMMRTARCHEEEPLLKK